MSQATSELNAEALYQKLLQQIQAYPFDRTNLAVVGIYSGGAWLAERLAQGLNLSNKPGMIDVSFYRDDYAQKGLHAEVKPTHIPFEVDAATIILVDDVLNTGRTTRAAINELFDYGRPTRILLATLIDRGGRELPITADFAAHVAEFEKSCSIVLHRADDGQLSLTLDHA